MAKAPTKPPATPPKAPTAAPAIPKAPQVAVPKVPYEITAGSAPPARSRSFGTPGEVNPLVEFLQSMPAPEGDTFATFFIPAEEAPATVTDADERHKFVKERARKITNNIGSLKRRITKKDPSYAFTTREVTEDGVVGVRVWRVEAEPATEATE